MNNNNVKILTRFLIFLSVLLFICFYGISHPKAYVIQDFKWLNRYSFDFPFTTNYEPYTYNAQYFWFNPSSGLPNYFIVNGCTTGGLSFDIRNVSEGNISYIGSISFPDQTCSVSGFTGVKVRYYFKLISYDIQSTTAHIGYNVRVENTSNWTVYVKFEDYTFSDTSDFEVLTQQQKTTNSIISSSSTNTQDIINNNNTNASAIIDNQNQNTQQQIESQIVCNTIDNKDIIIDGALYTATGDVVPPPDGAGRGVTDYIKIDDKTIIKNTLSNNTNSLNNLCFYNTNKVFISCIGSNNYNNNQNITIPSNANYIRFTIIKDTNRPQFEICKNGNQALSDDLNDLNDSINDDDIGGATQDGADFILDFDTNTFGLTSIVTAPLNLIESLTSSTCSELELPLPFLNNKKLKLPCMTTIYQNTFGSLFTMYQTITFGIIAYWVCVRIFNQVKDFKNPEHDEIEVVDL